MCTGSPLFSSSSSSTELLPLYESTGAHTHTAPPRECVCVCLVNLSGLSLSRLFPLEWAPYSAYTAQDYKSSRRLTNGDCRRLDQQKSHAAFKKTENTRDTVSGNSLPPIFFFLSLFQANKKILFGFVSFLHHPPALHWRLTHRACSHGVVVFSIILSPVFLLMPDLNCRVWAIYPKGGTADRFA